MDNTTTKKTQNNPEFTLEEYAKQYISCKHDEKFIKKELEICNTRIKELMKEQDLTEVPTKLGTVKYVVQHRESFDEDLAIKLLKKIAPETDCIKTKEYIDMDVLENELYHEKLSQEAVKALDKCKTVKEVVTLTIGKGTV